MSTSRSGPQTPESQGHDARRPRSFPFEAQGTPFSGQASRRDTLAGAETLKLMRQRPAPRTPMNTLARDALLGVAVGAMLVAVAALSLYRPYLEWAAKWLRP